MTKFIFFFFSCHFVPSSPSCCSHCCPSFSHACRPLVLVFPSPKLSSLRYTLHTCSCLFIEAQLFIKQTITCLNRGTKRAEAISIIRRVNFCRFDFLFYFQWKKTTQFWISIHILKFPIIILLKDKRKINSKLLFPFSSPSHVHMMEKLDSVSLKWL